MANSDECVSKLSNYQLHQLGWSVCNPIDDLYALIAKLNVSQSGMESQRHPGYQVLKAWINRGNGTTLRFLRLIFTEMCRMDLVNMLDEFSKDIMTLLLVIRFENGVCEERVRVSSSELISEVVGKVIREKYSGLIRQSSSFVKILGKEILENVTCLTFKGVQLDIQVKQNEAMKSTTSYVSSKYSPDDLVAQLSGDQMAELGKSIDTSISHLRDYLRLAHAFGEKNPQWCCVGDSEKLIKNWAQRPKSTFRSLENAFIEMERNDLRNMLQIYMNDSVFINILLIHEGKTKNVFEKVNSQCKVTEILRRTLKSRSSEFEISRQKLHKVVFLVKKIQLDDDARCEEYRNKQVQIEAVIDETKDSRNWPTLEVSLVGFCGFRDVTRCESENILKEKANGRYILRYQEDHRHVQEGKYAISFALNKSVHHLLIFESDDVDKLYYLTADGFHSRSIPSLFEHLRSTKARLNNRSNEFYLEPL